MKTKEKNTKKTLDAVQYMREQRDRITKDIINLSPDEIVEYFERKTAQNKIEHNNTVFFRK
jgi:hypothetical protein